MTESDTRAAILADLATRLRSVCAEWPDDLFNEMIERLADIALKYDGATPGATYDRRSTDRLIADLKAALERNQKARGDEAPGPGL